MAALCGLCFFGSLIYARTNCKHRCDRHINGDGAYLLRNSNWASTSHLVRRSGGRIVVAFLPIGCTTMEAQLNSTVVSSIIAGYLAPALAIGLMSSDVLPRSLTPEIVLP
jgi:hypothetical protein